MGRRRGSSSATAPLLAPKVAHRFSVLSAFRASVIQTSSFVLRSSPRLHIARSHQCPHVGQHLCPQGARQLPETDQQCRFLGRAVGQALHRIPPFERTKDAVPEPPPAAAALTDVDPSLPPLGRFCPPPQLATAVAAHRGQQIFRHFARPPLTDCELGILRTARQPPQAHRAPDAKTATPDTRP